jgi:predicted unusual protein kinase regulating ubiquinone biosynthesis (AarF/ABC1/UbiB family)
LVVTRARRLVARPDRRAELDERYMVRSADDVARELGHMKGAVMKLGQMLSFVVDGLPEEARAALAQLQADAPPMDAELAERVVRQELGAGVGELFAMWDPVPVAAASIGQVHRARLPDGRPVAVKVQYPGVDEAIGADLADARRIGALLSAVSLRSVDVDALAQELRDRMVDELDYRKEASNQQGFADIYRDHPFISVPDVVPERSRRRVLTSSWAPGMTFDELLTEADEDVRAGAGEAVFRWAQGCILRHRRFNGDPHPGNYRFDAAGRVTVLDFGLVKELTPEEFDGLMPVLDAVLDQDHEATTAAMVRARFLAPDHGLDPARVFACVSAPYRAYFTDEFTFTPAYTSDALRSLLDVRGPYADVLRALDMPPSFVLLDRVVWGVSAVLGRLHATGPWRGIIAEYRVGAEPATELGRAEMAWRAR